MMPTTCQAAHNLLSSSVNIVTTRSRAKKTDPSLVSRPLSVSVAQSDPIQTHQSSTLSVPTTNNSRIDFTGDLDALRSAQQSDAHIKHIIDHINDRRFANNYKVDNGILMHYEHHSKTVPCVPEGKRRRDIIQIYHDTPVNSAHFGRDKTLRKVLDRYYWDSLTADITHYVRSCIRCRENHSVRRKPAGHLQSIAPPEGVWQLLSMDFHGPLTPSSRRGNRYIISLTDILSKFVIARAVRDCNAATTARFLQEDVICKYGTPKCILTDNGTHFTSSMMETLLRRLRIVHVYATPYHPQTNGQIERFNGTIDAKLASLSSQSRSFWDDQLPYVILNYNTSVHFTTKLIPFELMYGRAPVLPCDPQNPTIIFRPDSQYAQKLQRHILSLTNIAQQNILLAHRSVKSRYDAHRSNPSYNIDGIVLIRNVHRRHKLDVRHEGPYLVVHRINQKTYLVQHIRQHHVIRPVTVDFICPLLNQSLI
jgi:transposase InsO family protein